MKEVYWNFSAIKNLFRQVNPSRVQAVSDLRDDDSIYSTEKALLLMFDKYDWSLDSHLEDNVQGTWD